MVWPYTLGPCSRGKRAGSLAEPQRRKQLALCKSKPLSSSKRQREGQGAERSASPTVARAKARASHRHESPRPAPRPVPRQAPSGAASTASSPGRPRSRSAARMGSERLAETLPNQYCVKAPNFGEKPSPSVADPQAPVNRGPRLAFLGQQGLDEASNNISKASSNQRRPAKAL